jgi:hypothetical protein
MSVTFSMPPWSMSTAEPRLFEPTLPDIGDRQVAHGAGAIDDADRGDIVHAEVEGR